MQTTDQTKTENEQQMEGLGATYETLMATAIGTLELAKVRMVNEAVTVRSASQGKGSFRGWDAATLKGAIVTALEELACGLDELAKGLRQMKEAIEQGQDV